MGHSYKRGTIITYYCTFLTLENAEPSSVVNPTITIRHVDEAYNLVTDINEAPMSLLAETTFFFKWNIKNNAYLGTYNIECSATSDGEYGESNETVLVVA